MQHTERFFPQNSIHAHSVYFFYTEACTHFMLCMNTCTIWITTEESNSIFKRGNVTHGRHSTDHNNLWLNIIKICLHSPTACFYSEQLLWCSITRFKNHQRNCSIPTQQILCVLNPLLKPLFQNKPCAKICICHLSITLLSSVHHLLVPLYSSI